MVINIDENLDSRFGHMLGGQGPAKGSLIGILQKTQEIYGYLPKSAIWAIAEKTGIKTAKIIGVATFYSQFKLEEPGKHQILHCKGTACHVNGASIIEDAANAFFESSNRPLSENGVTADGMFSLESVACLGCCSLSPVMMVDGVAYGSLNAEKTKKILGGVASGSLRE
ncbi:MAG: NAD(P)H-dependent oxidoreductase subunit E [Eubacteriaceae bacterium]|nr:NAD(P)H-dependent oxidoreductase subunit E [Eubacteriaceae bacterium]